MSEEDFLDGRYSGSAQVVRVLSAGETGQESFSKEDPDEVERAVAAYLGRSQQIFAHPNSPHNWNDMEITGPTYDTPVYSGRSQAIHVFGEQHGKPDPIPSCKCCEEEGETAGYTGGTFYSEGNSSADSRVRVRRRWTQNEATAPSGDVVSAGLTSLAAITYGGIHATSEITGTIHHAHDQTRIFLTHNNGLHPSANAIRLRFQLLCTNQYEGTDGGLDLPIPYRVFVGEWGAATPSYDQTVTDVAIGELVPEVSTITNGATPILNSVQIDLTLPMPTDTTRLQFGLAFGVPVTLEGNRNNGNASLPETQTFPPYPDDVNHYTYGVTIIMQPPTNTHYSTGNDWYTVGWMEGGTWSEGSTEGALGDCEDCGEGEGDTGSLLLTHNFANRTSAYGVTKLEGESTILNGPQFRFTMSGSSDWARSAGSGAVTSLGVGDDYQDTRAMITHTAPVGATYAKLKAQIRGSYSLAGPIVGDKPDPPPIGFAIREGTWGAALPNHGDVGDIVSSGNTYQVTEAIDPTVSESYSYSYLGGTAEIEAILPVVDGRVQFVMEVNQLQTHFLGERATSPFTGYDAEILQRYPNVTDDATQNWVYAASVFWSPWGNTNMTGNRGYLLEFYDGSATGGPCNDCEACEDPDNPGEPLPDFIPGYLPIFRRQIGDPTTSLDSYICTLESGAMALDWHTQGEVQVWGGELIPYSGRTEASIVGVGTNLGNVQQAWTHWGQHLSIRSGAGWDAVMAALYEGRGVILQGDYGMLTLAERCQDSFDGDHAMFILPYIVNDRILVGDPLCSGYKGYRESSLRAYAEDLSPGCFFAVTRPWAP
jgi:hypothetical protein